MKDIHSLYAFSCRGVIHMCQDFKNSCVWVLGLVFCDPGSWIRRRKEKHAGLALAPYQLCGLGKVPAPSWPLAHLGNGNLMT